MFTALSRETGGLRAMPHVYAAQHPNPLGYKLIKIRQRTGKPLVVEYV